MRLIQRALDGLNRFTLPSMSVGGSGQLPSAVARVPLPTSVAYQMMFRIGKPVPLVKSNLPFPAGMALFSDFQYCSVPGSGGVGANGRPLGAMEAGSVYELGNPRTRKEAVPVLVGWVEYTLAAPSAYTSAFQPGLDSFCTVPSASRMTVSNGRYRMK